MAPTLREGFRGCLLGLALGDALGGRFEAQSAEAIRQRFPTVAELFDYPSDELWYTDDTQMALGVAETLIAHGEIIESELCKAFVTNYVPSRGYGRGARAVLEAMEEGRDHNAVAERYFPGGSFGNGAAMRVAPIGLRFRNDPQRIKEQARLSALPTHRHPLGIEGARLLALGVGLASQLEEIQPPAFLGLLLEHCSLADFRQRLQLAQAVRCPADLAALGNGIEAIESVPTALASFALTPCSYSETVGNVILLGGDTDTLAAMAGALCGAYLGVQGLPSRLIDLLESSPKGRDYLVQLADSLHDAIAPGES
jgi:poly(ADP-ribose) glycohydrolase ARH3